MPTRSDKWVRSVKENQAGHVVTDPEGNRWQWSSDDDTARLLKKLHNDELEIERTDLHPRVSTTDQQAKGGTPQGKPLAKHPARKPGGKDAGGGFNPYDHSDRPKRR